MSSRSSDSAAARNPTRPRLTPSSGTRGLAGQLGRAQDRAVTAQHEHDLGAGGRGGVERGTPARRSARCPRPRRRGPAPRRPRPAAGARPAGPRATWRRVRCGRRAAPSGSPAHPLTAVPRRTAPQEVRLVQRRRPGAQPQEVLHVAARPGQRAGHHAAHAQPERRRPARRRRAPPSARSAGSRTTPPDGSRSRPTSNCGLTIGSRSASGRAQRTSAGSTRPSGMNDRSATTRSTGSPTCAGSSARTLVRSTHGDPRVALQRPGQLPVPDVDRDDVRRAAAQQQVGEPAGRRAGVQHPRAGSGRTPNASSAPASLCAPRETYDSSAGASTSSGVPASTPVAGLVATVPGDPHPAVGDQLRRLLPAARQAAADQLGVEAGPAGQGSALVEAGEGVLQQPVHLVVRRHLLGQRRPRRRRPAASRTASTTSGRAQAPPAPSEAPRAAAGAGPAAVAGSGAVRGGCGPRRLGRRVGRRPGRCGRRLVGRPGPRGLAAGSAVLPASASRRRLCRAGAGAFARGRSFLAARCRSPSSRGSRAGVRRPPRPTGRRLGRRGAARALRAALPVLGERRAGRAARSRARAPGRRGRRPRRRTPARRGRAPGRPRTSPAR